MKQANTTATPTSEEELRKQVDALLEDYFRPHHDYIYNANSTNDFLDAAIHLIHQYGNTREIEGRISERENTELPTTDHSECFDKRTCIGYQNAASDLYNENLIRIDELTKTKETPHETS